MLKYYRICGHKDNNVKLDSKSFGFPFDRDFDFNIHSVENRLK